MPSGKLQKVTNDEKINPLFVILAFGAGALLASMLLKKRDEKNKDKLEGYDNSNCKLKSP